MAKAKQVKKRAEKPDPEGDNRGDVYDRRHASAIRALAATLGCTVKFKKPGPYSTEFTVAGPRERVEAVLTATLLEPKQGEFDRLKKLLREAGVSVDVSDRVRSIQDPGIRRGQCLAPQPLPIRELGEVSTARECGSLYGGGRFPREGGGVSRICAKALFTKRG